jgi:ABC-type multidrug transport system permease subunit
MMVTGATVCSWDNTTRGLDASTAVDWARSLRVLTDIYGMTSFVSLYQASETIYMQFDKVMVIDEGRCVYYGPAKEARAYFEGLGFLEKPRQTTPDYLTGCTDPYEREFKVGRSASDVPSTPEALAKAYTESNAYAQMDQDMKVYKERLSEEKQVYEDFQQAVKDSKRHTSSKNVYTIPFYLQTWALMKRQFLLKWQDSFSLQVSWFTSIVIAIIIGTVWLNQPRTSAGAFTRGGVLFISLLFNAFQAFGELPAVMMGRTIVNKHRAFAFHRPSALWIGQILVDMLFASVQILVFSIIVYFMCGLVRDAGAFFIFYLLIVVTYLGMTLFFRTMGCLCPDFDVAIRIVATIITLFVLTSGYLIQWDAEQVWLRWMFYANALGLGFAAMMVNEFDRIDLSCEGSQTIPNGPGYGDLNHQSCTLIGSTPGQRIVSGADYIRVGFAYESQDLWRNFGIIIALIVGFLIANVFLGMCESPQWIIRVNTVTNYNQVNMSHGVPAEGQ